MGIITSGVRSTIFLILFLDGLFSFFKDPVHDQKNLRLSGVFGPKTFAEFSALSEDQPYLAFLASPALSEITVRTRNQTVTLDEEGNASISEDAVDNGSDSPHLPLTFDTDKTVFTCLDVGSNQVVLTVTDGVGNSSTGIANITIIDDIAPDIITRDITVQLDPSGKATISPEEINNGSTDACGIKEMSLNRSSFDCNDVGENTVVLTVEDNNGNSISANATVTIVDTTAPVAVARDIKLSLDDSGNATITPEQINNGSTDNCGIKNISLNRSSFDCNDIGEKTVVLTVEDHYGNSSSANATVTIVDTTAPVALAQDITVSLDDSGYATITPEQINNGSTDNCGIKNISLNRSSFDCNDIGEQTVVLTVEDHYGNTSSANATVTIVDTTAPVALAQDITVSLDDSGNAIITPEQVNNGSTDNCGIKNISLNRSSFDCNDIGEKTVVLTVEDHYGNTSSANATVTIVDTTAPVALTRDITVSLNDSGNASITPEQINNGSTDNCGIKDISLNLTTFDCNDLGENLVTLTVTDVNGNTASKNATVTVVDNLPPQVPVLSEIIWGCAYTLTPPLAIDNCAGEITGTTDSMTISESGMIVWTFTDGNGNKSEAEQKITINPISITITGKNIDCHGDLSGEAVAEISGGVAPFTYSWSNNTTAPKIEGVGHGTYTVTVTDTNGCTATEEITISQPEEIIIQPLTINPVSCHGGSNGRISINAVTGGNGGYRFSVNGSAFSTNKTYSGLVAGDYEVKVRDEKGCIVSQTITLSQPEEINMTEPTSTPVKCFGGNDGTITSGEVSGGTPPYQYSIDNINFQASGHFNSGVKAGQHSIFIRDANGCLYERRLIVEQPDLLKAIIKKTDVKCFDGKDGEIYLTNISGGSGSYEYSVDGENWTSTSETIKSLGAGSYTVLIRDAGNTACIVEIGNTTINQPTAITATYSTTRTTTNGSASGSATANPSGGTGVYSYLWQKEGDADFIQTTKTANNLLAGKYSVTIKDSNNCSITIPEIIVIDKVTAEINAISLCEDIKGEGLRTSTFSVDLPTVLGGAGDPSAFTYSWDFGTGIKSISNTSQGHKVEYHTGGDKIITLTIKDEEGVITVLQFPHYVGRCFENCGQSNNFEIDAQSFFIGDEDGNPITGNNCGPTTKKYLWFTILKNSNGYALNTEIKYSVNDGNETHKRVVMGCSGTKEVKQGGSGKLEYVLLPLGKYKLFEVSHLPSEDNSKIQWSCGQTFIIEGMTMRFLTNSGKECGDTGHMQCIGMPDNQEVSTPIIATATGDPVLCKGEALGSLTFSARGGIPPYRYSISGNNEEDYQSSGIFVNLLAASYDQLWVKDSRGITYQLPTPVIIEEPQAELSATVTIDSPIICSGGTAEVSVGAEGGTGPYSYLWNDEDETKGNEISGLSAGTYTVTIIDANGCQLIETVEITEPAPVTTAEAGPSQHLLCGYNNTFLEANSPDFAKKEKGTWILLEYSPTTINVEEIQFNESDPKTIFSAPKGIYTLQWSIWNEEETCSSSSEEVIIQFDGNCEQLDFDGIDDYVIAGDNYDFSHSEFSIEVWVKPEAINGNRTVLSKGNWKNTGNGGYELLINNGAPTFRWNNNSVTSPYKINTTRWYHLAVIFTKDRVDLYVDGIPVGNRTVDSFPKDVVVPFLIGGMFNASQPEKPENLYHGWIEEVRIWETALSVEQLRFMMNQRIEEGPVSEAGNLVKGEILPMTVPGDLTWNKLKGYYRLLAKEELIENGTTPNLAYGSEDAYLRNIQSFQSNSAPLPYISEADGRWDDRKTWDQAVGTEGEKWWEFPNASGIDGTRINWNIAFTNNTLTSDSRDLHLLALVLGGSLEMEGINPEWNGNSITPGTGNGLTITHYLKLDGLIDLNGESQLVQPEGSILTGSGRIEKDQQGTASSYNYNYWTSPVSTSPASPNSGYTIEEVMKDGTNPEKSESIAFNYQYHFADGPKTSPIRISTYWLNKFFGESGKYSQWRHVGHNGHLKAGEGFSMKGSSGHSSIKELQNYTFTGFPNNGTIKLNIGKDQGYLIGNPYPSAIDADEFILDNISVNGGNNTQNIFNGTLYFWDHFSGQTHYLQEYIGGYAIYNLSGGVRAIANDNRINNEKPNGEFREGEKIPQQFIPVGQAFFINTTLDDAIKSSNLPVTIHGGDIIFRNSQRVFMKETAATSVFHSQEPVAKKEKQNVDKRKKIRLKFHSPTGYHRQLLVTADSRATNDFDLGFDALLNETIAEDMYWFFNDAKFVIQGVPHLNKEQILPLGIRVRKNTEFTIRIDDLENIPEDMEIYLKDKQLNVLHDLRDSDYKSTAEPGTVNDRFELVFQGETPEENPGEGEENEEDKDESVGDGGKPDGGDQGGGGVENPEPDQGGIVSPKGLEVFYVGEDREIHIRNPHLIKLTNAFINNTLGQRIQEYKDIPEAPESRLPVRDFGAGVYIITINSETGPIIRKIIIE